MQILLLNNIVLLFVLKTLVYYAYIIHIKLFYNQRVKKLLQLIRKNTIIINTLNNVNGLRN